MAPARALKALYAVAVIVLLAAPAPAVPASARQTEPSAAPAPRIPGVRGLEIAVPAYAGAGAPMLTALTATTPAASVVVLNPGNGDAPFDGPWRARADALRAGTTATGEKTKVLGYVHTDHGNRDLAAVKASIDNYLRPSDGEDDEGDEDDEDAADDEGGRGGGLHVDGIFFDVVSRDCGPGNATRDHYAALRRYVQEAMHAADPDVDDLVVNNPGTAIADCYLEPGHRTADVFVTYEDTYAAYTAGGWQGNVFDARGGYRPGADLDPDGTAFWHLVHGVPDGAAMRTTLRTAFDRGAGYAYATGATMPNPWNTSPSWKYRTQTAYAATLGGADPSA
ncbi:spherulation-specific family 4 protein [Streptomyces sp. NPDC090077]|uniref:spherulation-specific family 4 protein n=1 Tax=Streptomyces sp. NPDC090077 TaxID=3365938 RepID=UPI0038177611